MTKYKITIQPDFGESQIFMVSTERGFVTAIDAALEYGYPLTEDSITTITCKKVEECDV